jgi:hypothetical protein
MKTMDGVSVRGASWVLARIAEAFSLPMDIPRWTAG